MPKEKWSQDVTEHSDALDLEEGVFKKKDSVEIARSLKRSAERSKRRKGSPLQSAMSMLTFYINRAGETSRPRTRIDWSAPRRSCASCSAPTMADAGIARRATW